MYCTHAWIADRPVPGRALHLAVEVSSALDLKIYFLDVAVAFILTFCDLNTCAVTFSSRALSANLC